MNPTEYWNGVAGAYEIERSLRFNDDDTAYLSRTPSSAGNRKEWTWSGWIKRGAVGTSTHGFFGIEGSTNYVFFLFNNSGANNELDFAEVQGGSVVWRKFTNRLFRDPSSWYHIVVSYDSPNQAVKIYINGIEETSFSIDTNPSLNLDSLINSTNAHVLGRWGNASPYYFDGYMTEVNFVDGTALTASDFGETDTETGAWIPKKYTGSYGTNGFYLNFSDNSSVSALGTDTSGRGNNWTPNNFSVTAGAGNDSLEDTPTNNWCTLNPLNRGVDNPTVDEGNLRYSTSGTDHTVVATFAIPSSGKWYWEYSKTADSALMSGIIYDPEIVIGSGLSTYLGGQNNGYSVYALNGQKYTGAIGNQTYMATPPTSTTITIAFDADNNKLYFGADGNWGDGSGNTNQTFANAAVAFTVPTGKTYYPAISFSSGTAYANFGQRAFAYTPPTGFKALNTANLPVPTIKDGTNHFDTLIYTGNATARSITGLNFAPDFVWHKARSAADDHRLMDSVRAGGTDLSSAISFSNLTDAEASLTGQLTQTSNGFDLVATTNFNNSGRTFVAWNWKAGGSGSSNTDGSITSTVSANVDAGFSIVTWSGNSTAGTSIGHGLNDAPSMIIVKRRNAAGYNWPVYHKAVGEGTGTNKPYAYLNLQAAFNTTGPAAIFDTNANANTASVFYVGNNVNSNATGGTYVGYCFAEVEGYSKFGSYTGNGSSNGPFVALPFKPAFLLIRSVTSSSSNWAMLDNTRNEFNVVNNQLFANLGNGEFQNYTFGDLLSNGFKIRDNSSGLQNNYNASGVQYVYAAFAETPFKYANAR